MGDTQQGGVSSLRSLVCALNPWGHSQDYCVLCQQPRSKNIPKIPEINLCLKRHFTWLNLSPCWLRCGRGREATPEAQERSCWLMEGDTVSGNGMKISRRKCKLAASVLFPNSKVWSIVESPLLESFKYKLDTSPQENTTEHIPAFGRQLTRMI